MQRGTDGQGPQREDAKEVTIVIADRFAWSQPYVRNLVRCLSRRFRVVILGLPWEARDDLLEAGAEFRPAHMPPPSPWLRRFASLALYLYTRTLRAALPQTHLPESITHPKAVAALALALRRRPPGPLIAVEPAALLACQLARRTAHLLSLELLQHDLYWLLVGKRWIRSVVTQNKLRYDILVPPRDKPCFIIPNFPIWAERPRPTRPEGFVFAGSAVPGLGILAALEFAASDADARLALVGAIPPGDSLFVREKFGHLLESGKVQLSTAGYTRDDVLIERLAAYRFGLSFYDLGRAGSDFLGPGQPIVPWSHANYWTGFPGKVGMYVAAGVPVIASNLPGTHFIAERGVGALVEEPTPQAIRRAAETIEADYAGYSGRCLALAQDWCFARCCEPFVDAVEKDAREMNYSG